MGWEGEGTIIEIFGLTGVKSAQACLAAR